MQHRNIPYYPGISSAKRVEIFVQEGVIDAGGSIDTQKAELYTTDQFLLIKTKGVNERFLATNLNLREDIVSGKEVMISYLDPTLGYVMPLTRLEFDLLS
jgi:hypothetical protein